MQTELLSPIKQKKVINNTNNSEFMYIAQINNLRCAHSTQTNNVLVLMTDSKREMSKTYAGW